MSFPLLASVANGNGKHAQNFRVFRIKNGKAVATNASISVMVSDLPFTQLDCVVDSEPFTKAIAAAKSLNLTQSEKAVTIPLETGRVEIILSSFQFPYDPDSFINFDEMQRIDPGNFIEATSRIHQYLKISSNVFPTAFVEGSFLNATDGDFIVRTPLTTVFPDSPFPITITRDICDLFAKIKEPLKDIYVGTNFTAFVFETIQIKAMKFNRKAPTVFSAYFGDNTLVYEPLPPNIIGDIKSMCSSALKGDFILFGPHGITLRTTKNAWTINHPMPSFAIKATTLKNLMNIATGFNFSEINKVVKFNGPEVEGCWSILIDPTQK